MHRIVDHADEGRPVRGQELRTLLSGRTPGVCLGRLTPTEAVAAWTGGPSSGPG